MLWKPDWPEAQANLVAWWERHGLALAVQHPAAEPWEALPPLPPPPDLDHRWLDLDYRCRLGERQLAGSRFLGEAFPVIDTNLGPGSLGSFLGAKPVPMPETIWYRPAIDDPDTDGRIAFQPAGNRWWQLHRDLTAEAVARSRGRYLVGLPDLIENLDTLAALRGSERLLTDLVDRPDWVHRSLAAINQAYFVAFDALCEVLGDGPGGNAFCAFRLWGPGRTAKIQCDCCCMLSPAMFTEFFVPYATAQCEWLDYSLYHLDGPGAVKHLDALLAIEPLDAIQWTPGAGQPGAGDPCWYDLYRRIRAGGKSVQVIGARPDEVVPLLDAVGPEGVYLLCWAPDQATAERIMTAAEPYR